VTIYVDEIRNYGDKLGSWSHMWTDGDESELHNFAQQLGLHREWVHFSKGAIGNFTHYDLRPSKRSLALQKGAVYKVLKEWIMEHKQGN
jgi:hypothetical protein